MRVSKPGLLSLLVSVCLVVAVVPSLAASAPQEGSASAARVRPAVVYAPEPGDVANDDPAGAIDITGKLPKYSSGDLRWGSSPGVAAGTIDHVAPATADVDWYKIDVTADQFSDSGLSYMVDVVMDEEGTSYRDAVVEVYYGNLVWGYAPVPACDGPDASTLSHWSFETTTTYWDDDSYWLDDRSPQASVLPHVNPGGAWGDYFYYIRVRPYSGGGTFSGNPFGYRLRIKAGQVTRLYGADRFATANAVCAEGWDPAGSSGATVTIVNGYKFPDALSGAGLAGTANDGPVLLCAGTSISHATMAQLQRMGTAKVYLLGGTASISNAVRDHILAHIPGANIKRIAGPDRYATAAEAAKELKRLGGAVSHVAFLANGLNWPDALVATAMAARNRVPILLTNPLSLPTATRNAMTAVGVTDVIVVGGTASVSNHVRDQVATHLGGASHVYRISAGNRYALAKKFAHWACDLSAPGAQNDGMVGTPLRPIALSPLNYRHIGVVSGETFPDALSAGPWCGRSYAPLLLTPRYSLSPYIFAEDQSHVPAGGMYFNGDSIRRSYLIGGPMTVSNSVLRDLDYNTGFAGPTHK